MDQHNVTPADKDTLEQIIQKLKSQLPTMGEMLRTNRSLFGQLHQQMSISDDPALRSERDRLSKALEDQRQEIENFGQVNTHLINHYTNMLENLKISTGSEGLFTSSDANSTGSQYEGSSQPFITVSSDNSTAGRGIQDKILDVECPHCQNALCLVYGTP